jgi:hypothetical protein
VQALKPIGYNWSHLAYRIGHWVPFWQRGHLSAGLAVAVLLPKFGPPLDTAARRTQQVVPGKRHPAKRYPASGGDSGELGTQGSLEQKGVWNKREFGTKGSLEQKSFWNK